MKIGDNVIMVDGKSGVITHINENSYVEIEVDGDCFSCSTEDFNYPVVVMKEIIESMQQVIESMQQVIKSLIT